MSTLTTICPQCGNESLVVTVEESGSGFHPEIGTEYWYSGHGVCPCGYSGEHGDSSA